MKKLLSKPYKSYYKKILLLLFMYLIIVIMPFTALLYQNAQKNILKNINRSNEQVLNQMKYNYTYFSESMSALCLSAFFRYDVKSVMYNTGMDYNQLYLTLKNLRDNILQSQPSLISIEIYNAQRNEWYSTNGNDEIGGAGLGQYVKEKESIPKLKPIIRKLEGNNGQADITQYVFSYFMYDYADPITSEDSYIVLNQNASWFINNMTGANADGTPTPIYLADKSGDVFGNPEKEGVELEAALVNGCVERILGEKKGQGYFVEKYEGKKYLLSYISLEDRDYCIIMVQRYDEIFSSLIALRNNVIIMSLIFSVIAVVIILHLSKKIYYPVDSLVDYVTELEGAGRTKQGKEDEFEYLKVIYQKTNEVKKELLQDKNSTKEILRRYLFSNLLEESTRENWDKYTNEFPEFSFLKDGTVQYMLVNYQLDNAKHGQYEYEDDECSLHLFSISNIMTELLEGYHMEMVRKDADSLVMLLGSSGSGQDMGEIINHIKYMQQFVQEHLGFTVSASYSQFSMESKELSELYRNVKNYAGYRLVFGPNSLMGNDECIENIKNINASYPRELNKRLRESLKLGKAQQIQEVLDKIRDAVSILNYDNIIINMMLLVTEINTTVNEINMARSIPIAIHFNDIYRKAVEAVYIDQIFVELSDSIDAILSDTYEKKKIENDKEKIFVETVMEFVKQNYTDFNLSSQSIADYMNMSGRYVMKKFKHCTEISLNEYILDIRMKQAAYLLRHTNLPVNKVAENIGIDNENYFYRLFKKINGCTPREFSKQKE